MSSPQDRFAGDPPPGTRDTGSDKPSGGEDRPSGAYQGDESVPTLSDPTEEPAFDTRFTNEPPRDVDPAVPPYEGRKTEGQPTAFSEAQGAKTGGATGPAQDAEYKSPPPDRTPGGATASPAGEQPASQSAESDTGDDRVGPGHTGGVHRAEDRR
jgi:hypothetical protein